MLQKCNTCTCSTFAQKYVGLVKAIGSKKTLPVYQMPTLIPRVRWRQPASPLGHHIHSRNCVLIECFGLKYCHRLSSRWSPLQVAKTFKVRLILKPATQTRTSRTNDFHKANFAVEMEARRKHFLCSANANVDRCPKGEAGCCHLTQGIAQEIFF